MNKKNRVSTKRNIDETDIEIVNQGEKKKLKSLHEALEEVRDKDANQNEVKDLIAGSSVDNKSESEMNSSDDDDDDDDEEAEEVTNFCVKCGVDIGPLNPRQLCGKTICHNSSFVIPSVEAFMSKVEDEKPIKWKDLDGNSIYLVHTLHHGD